MHFHSKDLLHINEHKQSIQKIQQDLKHFSTGFPKLEIFSPATLADGILKINSEEKQDLINTYKQADVNVLKFVPASGAASRMFSLLHQFLEHFPKTELSFESFIKQDEFKPLEDFFETVEQLPFYEELRQALKTKGIDVNALPKSQKAIELTQQMLSENGFDMGRLPKGLFPFHNYAEKVLSAFEEHVYEALNYAQKKNKIRLHFTISPEHLSEFQCKLNEIQPQLEKETDVDINVEFSFQHSSTDTICLDSKNEIFRDKDGKILFRPAGHGALIENLSRLDADLIFIKNVDNVCHRGAISRYNIPSLDYKHVLAGLLIQLQNKTFSLIEQLKASPNDDSLHQEAASFLKTKLNNYAEFNTTADILKHLNKPLRVCGMVINEGAPGGGPFWIKNEDGTLSLQIVEKSQIDLSLPDQKAKMQASTHFNPVDIACSFKNHKGENFDLQEFVDPTKGFIATKFVGGKSVKALELPGLWNGGMAFWNTVFVEVPSESFTPVKTVLDLVKPNHQLQHDV